MARKTETEVAEKLRLSEIIDHIANIIVDARRGISHTPACLERGEAFAKAIEYVDLTPFPLRVCSCDYLSRIEEAVVRRVVDEISGKTGGRFGEDAQRALIAEPGYKRRIAELEEELRKVHDRALT